LDTPKKMIERREKEKGRRRDIEREGEIREGGSYN
jgi:adenylate kinase